MMDATGTVTLEQLRLAWRHISRPGWPPTLEDALAIKAYRVALHNIARNLGRRGIESRRAEPTPPPAPQRALFEVPDNPGGTHAPHRTRPQRRPGR